MTFARHQSYRDAAAQWLGEIPSHWRSVPFRSLFRRTKRTGHASEELLSVYREYGVIRKADRDDNFNKASEDLDSYQLVEIGDLAVNKMKAWQGSLGISAHRGIVSPAYFVYVPTHSENARFLHYLLRSPPLAAAFMSVSKGIRIKQWDVDPDQLSQLPIPLPPKQEQDEIVAFLDSETTKIDSLVEEQQKLIALLDEKRRASISHAVTNGLDVSAPMKSSGVSWLPEIPAHWDFIALSRLVDEERHITYGIVQPGLPDPDGRFMVRGQDYSFGWAEPAEIFRVSPAIEEPYRRARIKPGDLVLTIVGAGTGNVAVVPDFLDGANLTQTTARIAPNPKRVHGPFLRWALASSVGATQVGLYQKGAAQPGLNVEHLKAFRIPLPPLEEQVAIASAIETEIAALEQMSRAASDIVVLSQERRGALISAAVTGKIDVRGIDIRQEQIRDVACAEIVRLSAAKPTFGRVKFQKLAFLAQAHNGIAEIGGSYAREAAGPLDRELMQSLEQSLSERGIADVQQAGGSGSQVTYKFVGDAKAVSANATKLLGDRCARLRDLIKRTADLDTKATEAVATLYAVWNDELIDGRTPTDDQIIAGVLNDWHPEKPKKFTADDLVQWLGWMRRNGIVPKGVGPKTYSPRLFA